METRPGISEIEEMGVIPQGSHFCLFFETDHDLHEMLAGFFKAGLENHEFCLWITSGPIGYEARNILKQVIPEAEKHIETGSLEIISSKQWYINDGVFDPARVLNSWDEKLDLALANGYAGMRVVADEAWLNKNFWKAFCEYEKDIDKSLTNKPIIIVCAYPAFNRSAAEILDVAQTHHYVAAKRNGNWEILEAPELKQAKTDFKEFDKEPERRNKGQTKYNPPWWPNVPMALNYGAAVLSVIVAVIIQFWMNTALQSAAYVSLFICAVMFSAWFGGIRPGLLAFVLSCLAFTYFYLPSQNSFTLESSQLLRLLIFALSALFVILLSASQKKAAESLRHTRDDLKNNNQMLRAEIIEHQQSAKALHESDSRLQAAIDASDIGLWEWDLASGQIIWLGHHEKLFGFTSGKFDDTYSGFEKCIHPDDLEELNRVVRRARDEGFEYIHEFRIVWPDGTIHWIAGRGKFAYNAAGQPVKMWGAVLDITDRILADEKLKSTTEKLRLSEEFFRLISENSFDMIGAATPEGSYIYANKAAQIFYGLTEEELLKINPFEWIYPDDRAGFLNYVGKNYNNKPYEFRLKNKHSEYAWLETFAFSITSGNVPYIIGIARDITDRKKAEKALLESETKFRELAESITDVFFAMDKDFHITYWNKASEKLSGIPAWVTIEKSLFDIFQDVKGSNIEEFFLKVIKTQQPDSFITAYTLIGKPYVFEVSAYPTSNGLSVFAKDITERKRAEEQLQKYAEELKNYGDNLEELVRQRTEELNAEKERAESADRLKSAFLAAMSHELRTPLNSIIGFTGILLQERPGPLNSEQKKQLGMAQYSARHLLSLINDILDLSKIEAGQLKVSFEPFNLAEIIKKVAETTEPFARNKNLNLDISISPCTAEIVSDKLRVQQILLNLVNNAIKFTEHGTVRIECARKANVVAIKISDTGIGIDNNRIEEIFHPFIQIDSGIARKHEGTGLGLSISKKLLQIINGSISVESKPGSGSIFTVTLPIEDQPK